jgi:hypothetical protein
MTLTDTKDRVLQELAKNDGLLAMKPCWVTRDFLPPGKRLGLTEAEYDAGDRGYICERWIVSETQADNAIFTPQEGQSFIKMSSGAPIPLVEALKACREALLGEAYAKKHAGLDRLLKIYDYKKRLFYHIHQQKADAAKIGMNSKEEAYHYLDADLGAHPETFFGVHPYIVKEGRQAEIFLPYLQNWNGGEDILQHARAYLNVIGEGFHLPPGVLHAPGTALTLELQESSDIMAVLQADIEGTRIDKALLTKHVPANELATKKERAVLDQVDWEACADPYFYENHRLHPLPVAEPQPHGVVEEWIWYSSTRFSGTRITLQPGASMVSRGLGVHGLFVWKGVGQVDAFPVEGQRVSLTDSRDEFLIAHDKAAKGTTIRNTGSEPMVAFKFFGPEINDAIVPYVKKVK